MNGSYATMNEPSSDLRMQGSGHPAARTPSGVRCTALASREVVMAMDDRLRYVFWNEAAEKLTGIPAGAALGRSFYELFPQGMGSLAEDAYFEVLRTHAVRTIITRFLSECYQVSVHPLPRGLLVTATEITKQTPRACERPSRLAVKTLERHADD